MWIYFITTITGTVFDAKDYPEAYGWLNQAIEQEDSYIKVVENPANFFEEKQLKVITEEYGNVQDVYKKAVDQFGSEEQFRSEIIANNFKKKEGTEWGG